MSEAPKIYADMAAIMRKIKGISKDQNNKIQGFKYRGIDDVYNAIQPIMGAQGVFCTLDEIKTTGRENRTTKKGAELIYTTMHLVYRFNAEDGSSVTTNVIGEGMDSGDKSSNKAMAVGHKYAIMQAFCIPTDDMSDPDAETHDVEPKPKPKPQQTTISDEIQALGKRFVEVAQSAPNLSALKKHLTDNGYLFDGHKCKDGSTLAKIKIATVPGFEKCMAVVEARRTELTNADTPFPEERSPGQEG